MSEDPLVVAELVATLRDVPGKKAQDPPAASAVQVEGTRAGDLLATVSSLDPSPSTAPPGAVVVPVGRGDDSALALALAIGLKEQRSVVLVDRGAEGLFGSPYGDLRGDDAYRPDPDRLFDLQSSRREGRSDVTVGLEVAETLGVAAGGWFPTVAGGAGMGEAMRRFDGGLLVVPASVRKPSLAERIRGMTSDSLAGLGVALVISE